MRYWVLDVAHTNACPSGHCPPVVALMTHPRIPHHVQVTRPGRVVVSSTRGHTHGVGLGLGFVRCRVPSLSQICTE